LRQPCATPAIQANSVLPYATLRSLPRLVHVTSFRTAYANVGDPALVRLDKSVVIEPTRRALSGGATSHDRDGRLEPSLAETVACITRRSAMPSRKTMPWPKFRRYAEPTLATSPNSSVYFFPRRQHLPYSRANASRLRVSHSGATLDCETNIDQKPEVDRRVLLAPPRTRSHSKAARKLSSRAIPMLIGPFAPRSTDVSSRASPADRVALAARPNLVVGAARAQSASRRRVIDTVVPLRLHLLVAGPAILAINKVALQKMS